MPGMAEMALMFAASMWIVPGAMVFVVAPLTLYVIARWRHARDKAGSDPQLGLKIAFGFFHAVGFQIALVGGFLLAFGIVFPDQQGSSSEAEGLLRTGVGLLLAGVAIAGIHSVLLARSNADRFPIPSRLTAGFNLLFTGAGGAVAVVFGLVTLLQKDVPSEVSRAAWCLMAVYLAAWIILVVLFMRRHATGPSSPSHAVVPPSDYVRSEPGFPVEPPA